MESETLAPKVELGMELYREFNRALLDDHDDRRAMVFQVMHQQGLDDFGLRLKLRVNPITGVAQIPIQQQVAYANRFLRMVVEAEGGRNRGETNNPYD